MSYTGKTTVNGCKYVKIEGNHILRYERYFDKHVITASIDHENKVIRPSHGYFYPHKHGKSNKAYAKKLGYVFNNN